MDLLLDTHMLVWASLGSRRMSSRARDVIFDNQNQILVSPVVAWEYTELNRRGRFEADLPLAAILERLEANVIDLPAGIWRLAESLPSIHRDPVDRMLVAHAIHAGLPRHRRRHDPRLSARDALVTISPN